MVKVKNKVYVRKQTSKYVERNESLSLLYNEIRHKDILTHEQTKALFDKYKNGSKKEKDVAFKILCEHNMRLVVSVAKKYCTSSDNLNDLIQEGCVGLIEAIENFDIENGAPFYAYAVYWIRREINMFKTNVKPIVTKTNRSKTSITINSIKNELIQKLERNPTEDEILHEYNEKHPEKKLNKKDDFVDVEYVYVTDFEPVQKDENKISGAEFEYNKKTESHNEFVDESDKEWNKDVIERLINRLTPKEQKVIKLFYGLDGGYEASPLTISQEMSMTEAGVNNIRLRAIDKMKKNYKSIIKSFV